MRTKVEASSVNDGGRKLVEELTPSCVTRSLELCTLQKEYQPV
jgi:hypothetical protein